MIPTYDKMMLPMLQLLADGKERTRPEVIAALASQFTLTAEDLAHRLPSGRQTTVANRIGWARTRLGKAGLVEAPARGVLRITNAGQEVLRSGVLHIDDGYLMRFAQYREWIEQSRGGRAEPPPTEVDSAPEKLTPEELIATAFEQHRQTLEDELLVRVRGMDPYAFEGLVVDLLLKLGYGGALGDGRAIGRSGDGGIDGVIREDKLGLELVYIQAKRWSNSVGRPEVQAFIGSLEGLRARKGVFITTSGFTREARDYVERIEKRVVLIDGSELAHLMFDAGVGVSVIERYEVKTIDNDYFLDA
ncbi:MAG TPA: restriction endonuclease [Tepidiformaceae bacterium]|nr:restriction endonuclease [Tepidiformaceae bacterium]